MGVYYFHGVGFFWFWICTYLSGVCRNFAQFFTYTQCRKPTQWIYRNVVVIVVVRGMCLYMCLFYPCSTTFSDLDAASHTHMRSLEYLLPCFDGPRGNGQEKEMSMSVLET